METEQKKPDVTMQQHNLKSLQFIEQSCQRLHNTCLLLENKDIVDNGIITKGMINEMMMLFFIRKNIESTYGMQPTPEQMLTFFKDVMMKAQQLISLDNVKSNVVK